MSPTQKPIITPRRYPVGESWFPNIREKEQVYIDKTGILYNLAQNGTYYFLNRPRRFGKSLMLSTLKAYFQGRKELFRGLEIEQLETEWRVHPVIHLSMGGTDFSNTDALKHHLLNIIEDNELSLSLSAKGEIPEVRFFNLIREARRKFNEKVVILIDEYDKPILDTRHRCDTLHDEIKAALRGFYGCIKESAEHIRFVMITGITKFSHVNIFSGLNNLDDISLRTEYNDICGISESEMHRYFTNDMAEFGYKNGITTDAAAAEFKSHYDGYLFASQGENIYNPFSVMKAFSAMKFGNYWFQSGTSYYLVKEMERSNYDFQSLEGTKIKENDLAGTRVSDDNIVALLFQAGYLTIKDYTPEGQRYTLGFPNKEVSSGFFQNLLEAIMAEQPSSTFSSSKLIDCVLDGNPEGLMHLIKVALAQYNYEQLDAPATEKHFVLLVYTLCMAIGLDVKSEMHTARGRIDLAISSRRFIYIIEFKVNSYPKRALNQINERGYADKFIGDTRRLFKIGANFSTKTRTLTGWIIES